VHDGGIETVEWAMIEVHQDLDSGSLKPNSKADSGAAGSPTGTRSRDHGRRKTEGLGIRFQEGGLPGRLRIPHR